MVGRGWNYTGKHLEYLNLTKQWTKLTQVDTLMEGANEELHKAMCTSVVHTNRRWNTDLYEKVGQRGISSKGKPFAEMRGYGEHKSKSEEDFNTADTGAMPFLLTNGTYAISMTPVIQGFDTKNFSTHLKPKGNDLESPTGNAALDGTRTVKMSTNNGKIELLGVCRPPCISLIMKQLDLLQQPENENLWIASRLVWFDQPRPPDSSQTAPVKIGPSS
ncbi:hypothetical protein STEG23_022834 [Scotinomys teguina]